MRPHVSRPSDDQIVVQDAVLQSVCVPSSCGPHHISDQAGGDNHGSMRRLRNWRIPRFIVDVRRLQDGMGGTHTLGRFLKACNAASPVSIFGEKQQHSSGVRVHLASSHLLPFGTGWVAQPFVTWLRGFIQSKRAATGQHGPGGEGLR